MQCNLVLFLAAAILTAAQPALALELPPLGGFDTRTPEVAFDVPATLACHDVTTDEFLTANPGMRLVEVVAPVSLLLFHGEPGKVEDMVLEIDGAAAGLKVHDYAPRTELASELAQPVEVRETIATDKSIAATIGAKLAPEVCLTPTLTAGASRAESATVTRSELPPKQAVVVSGTTGGRSGVYFKLRRSTQSTLEGERVFRVTFAAPADWDGGSVEVRCLARGEKKWLFVDQRRVWNATTKPVELRLVSHITAKPVVDEAVKN